MQLPLPTSHTTHTPHPPHTHTHRPNVYTPCSPTLHWRPSHLTSLTHTPSHSQSRELSTMSSISPNKIGHQESSHPHSLTPTQAHNAHFPTHHFRQLHLYHARSLTPSHMSRRPQSQNKLADPPTPQVLYERET